MASQPTSPGHRPHTPHTPSETAHRDEAHQQEIYGERCGHMDFNQTGIDTNAQVADDGRVNINITEHGRRLSKLLTPVLKAQNARPLHVPPSLAGADPGLPVPRLSIVIQIVGSRGDVQPFVALGRELKQIYGHRVRLATHPNFREFVQENGLEFFDIGGDPAELMAFMVKNPGLMPGFDAMRNGDIGKRRKEISQIITGCWRSCFEAGDGTGPPITDSNFDARQLGDCTPFVADAIIANPPSFAHIHCAEKLGIPLHMMFTMPWSPTQAFHHPLANIQFSNAEVGVANFVSYALVEMMTWQGLGDVINRFRERCLGLEPMSIMWAPGVLPRLHVPYTYCWSPSLIPKPKDWGPYIDISGFFFLPLASTYTPPDDLAEFLAAGPPPVYIGFGSIVLDDPNGMTKLIFEAIKKTGQRALVSKGWGGFGAEEFGIPEGVYMIGNCPHDWLFKRVSCVVHHGGAGTTAAGITFGKPTVVVPFFGDQPFWGSMVAKAGAGPKPIPHKQLTADNLADAITAALKPEAKRKAEELGAKISHEDGVGEGGKSFHRQLHADSLRCMLIPSRPAVWRVRHTNIRLCSFAVTTLANEGILDLDDLKLYRPREYSTEPGPRDPITGGAAALIESLGDFAMGFADVPVEIVKAITHAKRKSRSGLQTPSDSSQVSVTDTTTTLPDSSTSSISTIGSASESTAVATEEESSDSRSDRASTISSAERSGSSTDLDKDKLPEHRNITAADILSAGQAATKIINKGLKSPMNFTLGVAKGFHNAPRLYGDKTVRQSPKITGFHSGIRAAGKELGYGFYDGISGLVTQPLAGRKEGVGGVVKGFGKGIGGLIFKPGAGIWGLTGYTMSGVYKEIQKRFGTSIENYIIASRSIEGYEEWRHSCKSERNAIIRGWYSLSASPEVEVRNSAFASELEALSRGIFENTNLAPERKRDETRDSAPARAQKNHPEGLFHMFRSARQKFSDHHHHHHHHGRQHPSHLNLSPTATNEVENAIRESVKVSSSGNEEEDKTIERALRASVAELQLAEADGEDEQQAYARAIEASIEEAKRARKENRQAHARAHYLSGGQHKATKRDGSSTPKFHVAKYGDGDHDEDEELERIIAESIRSHAKEQQRDKDELESLTEYAKWKSSKESDSGPKQFSEHQPTKQASDECLRQAIEESLKMEGADVKSF
ncbi:hypothetical protein AJ79_07541 [Helicocarpus griseus UAMH5409]|uniref:Uncharacterized protein n=1 Tax=Helicocarpus griseus UAMH5409 TaxID=1447875 RepID=A0A2B7X156_9EURO|nr:hypothetical protein AJ79_07541 [Helicocarpus griseus UAMH5409]